MGITELLYIAAVDDHCEYGEYRLLKRMVKEANRWSKGESCKMAYEMIKNSLTCASIKFKIDHFRGRDAIFASFKGGEITITTHE